MKYYNIVYLLLVHTSGHAMLSIAQKTVRTSLKHSGASSSVVHQRLFASNKNGSLDKLWDKYWKCEVECKELGAEHSRLSDEKLRLELVRTRLMNNTYAQWERGGEYGFSVSALNNIKKQVRDLDSYIATLDVQARDALKRFSDACTKKHEIWRQIPSRD